MKTRIKWHYKPELIYIIPTMGIVLGNKFWHITFAWLKYQLSFGFKHGKTASEQAQYKYERDR